MRPRGSLCSVLPRASRAAGLLGLGLVVARPIAWGGGRFPLGSERVGGGRLFAGALCASAVAPWAIARPWLLRAPRLVGLRKRGAACSFMLLLGKLGFGGKKGAMPTGAPLWGREGHTPPGVRFVLWKPLFRHEKPPLCLESRRELCRCPLVGVGVGRAFPRRERRVHLRPRSIQGGVFGIGSSGISRFLSFFAKRAAIGRGWGALCRPRFAVSGCLKGRGGNSALVRLGGLACRRKRPPWGLGGRHRRFWRLAASLRSLGGRGRARECGARCAAVRGFMRYSACGVCVSIRV